MPSRRHATPIYLLALALLAACDDPGSSSTAGTTTSADDPACPDYLQFCVTAELRGSVTAEATAGYNHRNIPCADWAAAGPARILELPGMLSAGDVSITVALTRIGAYTGPGTYELRAETMTGDPDAFPAIDAAGRFFTNDAGSTTTVTISADGSGTVEAAALSEHESVQMPTPDPNARVDFTLSWTCNPAVAG